VLVLLSQGLSHREIGEAMNIAESTVKVHLGLVFRVMGVVNRTQAAVEARKLGLKV
jgi:two-component system, NarL family, nitrate/nitrite response regulator NarL